MREAFLPFSKPDLDDSEKQLINEVLDSGWLTTGKFVRQLEQEFAAEVGAKYAVAVNSATAALHLSLEAIGLAPGDEVITTPYTFASTAEVVRYFGATPRFVDICSDTLNIDPGQIEQAITPRTKAIIPVHIGGHPADLDSIDRLAAKYGLAVIEDAAHSLPAAYHGTPIGAPRPTLENSPHLVCFSFYATKTMTTGEGGAITTDDETLAERCRLMSLHGISKNAWNRYAENGSWYYEILSAGYKYNLTDIAAAIGIAQLQKLHTMRDRRAKIAARFNEAFADISALQLPTCHPHIEHSWHLYAIRLNHSQLSIDRNRFIEELSARKIGTSVHFIPLHLHPYYRETYGYKPEDFPVATAEYEREISLPIYSAMNDSDVCDVVEAVKDIINIYSLDAHTTLAHTTLAHSTLAHSTPTRDSQICLAQAHSTHIDNTTEHKKEKPEITTVDYQSNTKNSQNHNEYNQDTRGTK